MKYLDVPLLVHQFVKYQHHLLIETIACEFELPHCLGKGFHILNFFLKIDKLLLKIFVWSKHSIDGQF